MDDETTGERPLTEDAKTAAPIPAPTTPRREAARKRKRKRRRKVARPSLNEKYADADRRKKEREADENAAALALAAEPVPLGSGLVEVGKGIYKYMKANWRDGSMCILSFTTRAAAEEAMAIGIAADEAREARARGEAPN